MTTNDFAWSTGKEIEYIKNIGSTGFTGLSKVQLLKNYLKALKNRERWDKINKELVISFIKKELKSNK